MAAITSVAPLRRAFWPALAGVGVGPGIALTYDDGPDPAATPHFLELLEHHGVRATCFVLGEHVESNRELVGEMAARGHELAIHGWDHRCVLRKRRRTLAVELMRTVTLLEDVVGERPRWYRPPYGVLSLAAQRAAHDAGLRTVLWSTWGRDWQRSASATKVAQRVARRLAPGGTVLLHDSDRMSAPESWVATLGASRILLADWAARGVAVGPLRDHGL